MTPKQFALEVEKRASKKITHLINRNLKDKIKMNAQDLNFLPKTATLPV